MAPAASVVAVLEAAEPVAVPVASPPELELSPSSLLEPLEPEPLEPEPLEPEPLEPEPEPEPEPELEPEPLPLGVPTLGS